MFDPHIFDTEVLNNGLTVHTRYLERPFVKIGFLIQAGARDDIVPGTAHYTEHLAADNIKGITDNQIKKMFEICGGDCCLGITTYKDTFYSFGVPISDNKLTKKAFKYFSTMLLGEKIERNFVRQGQIINMEFVEYYDFPERIQWNVARSKSIFHNSRKLRDYNDPSGTPETVRSITRNHVKNFYKRYYVPKNIIVIAVGGYTHKEIINFLKASLFNSKKEGKRNTPRQNILKTKKPKNSILSIEASNHTEWIPNHTEFKFNWALPKIFSDEEVQVFWNTLYDFVYNEFRQKRGWVYRPVVNVEDYGLVYEIFIIMKINVKATIHADKIMEKCLNLVAQRSHDINHNIITLSKRILQSDYNGDTIIEEAVCDLRNYGKIFTLKESSKRISDVKIERVQKIAKLLLKNGGFSFCLRP